MKIHARINLDALLAVGQRAHAIPLKKVRSRTIAEKRLVGAIQLDRLNAYSVCGTRSEEHEFELTRLRILRDGLVKILGLQRLVARRFEFGGHEDRKRYDAELTNLLARENYCRVNSTD